VKTITSILIGVVAALAFVACAVGSSPETPAPSVNELNIAPVAGGGGGCVENVLCIQGDHWDRVQCKCVPNACVSGEDGPCGGFSQKPCTCAAGLVCKPNRIPDIPGTCEPQRCCPAGWSMYACQEENGSSGFNCHNPKLGCASSDVCGAGCDLEVSGRCPVCDPIPCPAGQVFDRTACKCVAAGCASVSDCSGPVPQLCEVCSNGTTACAHWACVTGQCQVAICP